MTIAGTDTPPVVTSERTTAASPARAKRYFTHGQRQPVLPSTAVSHPGREFIRIPTSSSARSSLPARTITEAMSLFVVFSVWCVDSPGRFSAYSLHVRRTRRGGDTRVTTTSSPSARLLSRMSLTIDGLTPFKLDRPSTPFPMTRATETTPVIGASTSRSDAS